MRELHTPVQAARWLRSRVQGHLWADSRQVHRGDGFIAWPGAATDGRRFAAAALSHGAAACLVEREGVEKFVLEGDGFASYADLKTHTGPVAAEFYGHPSQALDVVAVTGTNGKTSTAWLLAQALSALPPEMSMPCGVVGTLGVGRPPHVRSTGLTTPDPVQLQRTLREFVGDGVKACAIEASSIGVEEHRLAGTLIRVAVFTNFTQDHLDYHGSMDHYWDAKRRLFDWQGLSAAVLNIDDAKGAELARELASGALDVWTCSVHEPARLRASDVRYGAQGLAFDVVEGTNVQPMHSRMIGLYNVSNLLCVLGSMRALGVPLVQAVQACSDLQAVPGRMECITIEGQPLVAVDYAHTPDALAQALTALQPLAQQRGGKLWCVFGCGGDRDATKRPLMGAISSKLADCVVVTSDNPRSEKPESIIAQILLGLPQSHQVTVQSDRATAIAQTIEQAHSGDVVLLAGKGHEATQEIAGVKLEFSDRTHAEKALQGRIRQAEPAP
jgi:UDP-N-acetylmuramyl-tripeptide synthetase